MEQIAEFENATFWLKEENNNISDSSLQQRNNDTSGASDGDYPVAQDILYVLNLYYLGGIVVVGVLGNGKNVVSFIISRNERRSPSYYLASLALADTIFLAVLFIIWLNHFDIELFSASGIYHMFFYISSASSCLSAWLVVAFTFERLIVVRYPLKRYKLCTVRRAKIIIAWLTVVIAIIQAISLSTTGVKETPMASTIKSNHSNNDDSPEGSQTADNHWTTMLPSYYQVMRVFNMLEVFATLAVPPLLIGVMNGLIIHGLFQFNRIFKTGTNKHRSSLRTQQPNNCKPQVTIQMKAMGKLLMPTQGRAKSPLEQHLSGSISLKDESVINVRQNRDMTSYSSSNCISNAINNCTTLAVVEEQPHQAIASIPSSSDNALRDLIDPVLGSSANDAELLFVDVIVENKNTELESSLVMGEGSDCPNESSNEGRAEEIQQQRMVSDAGISRMATHVDMDAIQTDTSHLSARDDNGELQTTVIDVDQHRQVPSSEDQQQVLIENHNEVEANRHRTTTTTCSEYSITKKLVIISTFHILLNMPSCVMNLKLFIDETITPNSDVSQLTWILQEFSMCQFQSSIQKLL